MAKFMENPSIALERSTDGRGCELNKNLEMLAHQAQGQLGPTAQTAFFVGDGLQRAATDAIFDALQPPTWSPGNLLRASSRFFQLSARLFQLLAPGEAELAWRELKNKAEVFALVKNLSSILKLSDDEITPLPDLVNKAYAMPAFEALWAVEGVGHYYADKCWSLQGTPAGLLLDPDSSVPAKSFLMLHAGMGLCFADRLIGALTTEASPNEVKVALEQFLALCKNNSLPGYLGAAIESLGIVTRDFHPELFDIITRQVRSVLSDFAGYYWHGIGRAIYFSRKFFLPHLFSMWSEVNVEAASEAERQSTLAGLTWAFTLVNMRHPAIVESSLRQYSADSAAANAVSNGVSSCIVMRSDTTPDEPWVSAFYEHVPHSRDRQLRSAWEHRVVDPGKAAVEAYYPALHRHQKLDQVFRYADLPQLVEQLKAQESLTPSTEHESGCGCCGTA
jgi:hypothetical protein